MPYTSYSSLSDTFLRIGTKYSIIHLHEWRVLARSPLAGQSCSIMMTRLYNTVAERNMYVIEGIKNKNYEKTNKTKKYTRYKLCTSTN